MRIMWLVGAIAMVGCSVNVGSTFCEEDADCPRGYSCVTEDNKCVEGVDPPSCSRDVAAGGAHTCSVRDDGSVWCWGRNDYGQLGNGTNDDAVEPVQVVGIANATAVVVGYSHSCALLDGGEVRCWGLNNLGQLGDNDQSNSNEPKVVLADAMKSLTGGGHHTCALDLADTVVCWGANDSGQLGDRTTTNRRAPIRVDITATRVAAGEKSTCAIDATGDLHCWGSNSDGQLGLGNTLSTAVPKHVDYVSGVEAVAMGNRHTCIVIAGDVQCTGFNREGQLGIGSTNVFKTFQAVEIPARIVALALGANYSCARDDRSHMWCWGENGFSRFASGRETFNPWPVQSVLPNVDQIAAGAAHLCVRDGAAIWCSGDNGFGQLGNGDRTTRGAPQVVPLVTGAVKVVAGARFSCSIGADKTAQCWGENDEGELGDGTFHGRATPAPLELANVDQIAAGTDHACAITATENDSRALWCWGWNGDGQLGDGTNNMRGIPGRVSGIVKPIAVAVGHAHTCAIDHDDDGMRRVKCWGEGREGQLGSPQPTGSWTPVTVSQLSSPISIAAGERHSCAVLSDETVWCWGENAAGQLGSDAGGGPTPVKVPVVVGARDVRARGKTTFARLASGSLWSWGYGCEGELGVPIEESCGQISAPQDVVTIRASTAVSLGDNSGCALQQDRTVACWGGNWFGQLGDGTYAEAVTPTPVRDLNDVVDISVGSDHACAVKQDGTVACWGLGASGELGDGIARLAEPTPARLVCE